MAALALAGGCAQQETVGQNEAGKRFLEAWISQNHPGAKLSGHGIYILSEEPGSGPLVSEADRYVFIDYTVTDLEGNISATTSEALAKQLGTYSPANVYGRYAIVNAQGQNPVGLLDIVDGMATGGSRKALVPGWLNNKDIFGSAEEYYSQSSGEDAIYTVRVLDKTADINAFEVRQIESSPAAGMSGADSLEYGFYHKVLREGKGTDALPSDTTILLNYTARRLDGQVFDTTVEDSAKVHGIYTASRTYDPVAVTMNQDLEQVKMKSGNSSDEGSGVVKGFALALSKMKPGEKCRVAFISSQGYGARALGGLLLPPFSPLVFELELVSEE